MSGGIEVFDKREEKELEKIGYGMLGVAGLAAVWGTSWAVRHPEKLPAWVGETVSTAVQGAILTAQFSVATATVATAGYAYQNYQYQKRAREEYRYLRVLPHTGDEPGKEEILALINEFGGMNRPLKERLKRGREWFRLLIHCDEQGRIGLYVGFPQDREEGVKQALKTCYRRSDSFPIRHEQLPLPDPAKKGYGGYMVPTREKKEAGLPFQRFNGNDQVGNLLEAMRPHTWIDLVFSPTLQKPLAKQVDRTRKYLLTRDGQFKEPLAKSELSKADQVRLEGLDQRYTGLEKVFEVSIAVWSENRMASPGVQTLGNRLTSMMEYQNGLHLKLTKHSPVWGIAPYPMPMPWKKKKRTLLWTDRELAHLLHFPSGSHAVYQLPQGEGEEGKTYLPAIQKGQAKLTKKDFTHGLYVGDYEDPIDGFRSVRLPYRLLTHMGFGAGKIGSGKTALFLAAMYDHLEQWYNDPHAPGFTFWDPKGDASLKLLSKMLSDELAGHQVDWDRVVFIDLASEEYVLGLNLLHRNPGESVDTVADNALNVLKNAYSDVGSSGMLLEKFGHLALQTLLQEGGEHSILGMEKMLRKDPKFRQRVLQKLDNDVLEEEWKELQQELKKGQGTLPIANRLQKIKNNTILRRMFGQTRMGLNVKEWMDEGYIVIFRSAGLSDAQRALVAGYIITQYHQQAQLRKLKNKPHFHFVDEFHLLQIPVVKRILSLDRYTGHSFIPITQYADQLNKDMLNAFDGTVDTFISCTVGSGSAENLYELSGKTFDPDAIQHLRPLTAAISTKNNEGNRVAFYVKTPPPFLYGADGKPTYYGRDQVRQDREEEKAYRWAWKKAKELMQKHCDPAEQVDQWILEYRRGRGITPDPQPETTDEAKAAEPTPPENTGAEMEPEGEITVMEY